MKMISMLARGLFIFVMVTLTLTACFDNNSKNIDVLRNEHATLRIMTMEYVSGTSMTMGVYFQGLLKSYLEEPFQKNILMSNFNTFFMML